MKALCRASKLKRLILLAVLCFSAVMLTGCGASVTVYDFVSDGTLYSMYELEIDRDTVERMEATAATDDDGEKYTVETYFFRLFTGYGCELVDASSTDKAYTVRYRKQAVGGKPELYETGQNVEFTTTHTENPFVRTYTAVSPNPFNGVRAAYDAIDPNRSSTLLERIKNGIVVRNEYDERSVVFPSIDAAFPYLKGANLDGLLLNYERGGSSRMKSSGQSTELGDKTSRYTFSRYFDLNDTQIAFEYRRPVPYGWYMTALAAGAVTIVVLTLVTRTKKQKQKPTLLDRFPYDPEEYRDYDSNLPSLKR